ncbi:MAG: DEAD/DEAH box helicase family protein [Armatimonadetes bacterium]|nr:DEAD/DEAH box helicase family protein [Armatimonadota bacterium]
MAEKLPTILDNRGDNKVLAAFERLLPMACRWQIATGYFEIGSLLDLDGLWQPLEELRLLLGDEVTRRTRAELVNAVCRQSDESIEAAKEKDGDLRGLEAIRRSLSCGHIRARVYTKAKFHAKGYILDGSEASPFDFAVVGSSNFTHPGLTQNIELNLLTTDQNQIESLRRWYEQMWSEAEDISEDVLRVLERHLREYRPFEIYARALYEYFLGRDKSQTEWEREGSVIYPILSKYQRDGYHRALQIAERWNGALVCDGVGLGKTFIGLMLLENALFHKKKALLIVPKSARKSVWERYLDSYLKPEYRRAYRDQIVIHNHTDFGRDGTIPDEDIAYYHDFFDVIVVDEAHHFRNPSRTRCRKLMRLCRGKQSFFLTATPINNSLVDLYNLINFFAQDNPRHFASIGIQNLRRHFTEAERNMGQEEDIQAQSSDFIRTDALLKEILIQRSRRFVMDSEAMEANRPCFPERQTPQVIRYSLNKVYAGLYEDIKLAFQRAQPMLSLAVYNTEAFKRGQQDKSTLDYQANVLGLIRTLLLKRLESSYKAFEASLEDLLNKMALFVQANAPQMWEAWQRRHANLWTTALFHKQERYRDIESDSDEDEEENDAPPLPPPLDDKTYDTPAIIALTLGDMTQLVTVLTKVYQLLSPQTDDKLARLEEQLQSPELKGRKLVIFTEFRDTARYLFRELKGRMPGVHIEQLDSGRKIDREKAIKRFAPYYNCSPQELPAFLNDPIDILISTDVLSEGLNLQDANHLLNYDVHWNPVRLMQRIGRVDRRLDVSKPIHHEKVYIYNFLPPKELDDLLNLLKRVSGKILRINSTLGIEAPILTPDDPEAAMKLFNEQYEQQESRIEKLELELQRIEMERPELYASLSDLPRRIFSGREGNGAVKGLFCAYRFPAPDTESVGELRWYFRDFATGEIREGAEAIADLIRCEYETPRRTAASEEALRQARSDIETQKVRRHLRDMQAVAGSKAVLVCSMEVC